MPIIINGSNNPTSGGVGYGNGTELAFTAAGTAGQVLQSNGASAPIWAAVPTVNLATGVTGTLPVGNGGTGITSGTSGGILYFSATNTLTSSGALTANALMIGGGGGVAPSTTSTGTGVLTALGTNVGSAGAFVVNGGALGTPSSGTLTNATGLPLSTGVTGTLAVANGGTGVNSSTGSGSNVLSTSPTLVTPVLGTPTSGNLQNCTVDGTSLVGYRNVPLASSQSSSYTLAASDTGKYIRVTTGGSITVPVNVFGAGDVVTIYNFTTGSITITCSAVTTFIAGVNTVKSSVTLATRGIANIFFNTANDAVISGNVS